MLRTSPAKKKTGPRAKAEERGRRCVANERHTESVEYVAAHTSVNDGGALWVPGTAGSNGRSAAQESAKLCRRVEKTTLLGVAAESSIGAR